MKKIELTLALFKPDVQRFKNYVLKTESIIIQNNLQILFQKELIVNKELAQNFYSIHRGKFYYDRLVNYMTCGHVGAYILKGENAINNWRSLLGPTKVYRAIHEKPDSLRGKFGLTDTRNGYHGSDSQESALLEIKLIFPEVELESLLNTKIK